MYTNARSIMNKIPLLHHYITSFNLHVVCLTETWLCSDIPDAFFTPPGYIALRCDRRESIGGGALILVKNELNPVPFPFGDLKLIEASGCIIQLPNHVKLVVACVYRPPSHNLRTVDECSELINKVMALKMDHNIIIGDFNMPLINWVDSSCPPKYHSFMTTVDDNFLIQHIKDITRPSSGTILDLLFTSIGTPLNNISVDECLGSSDHATISFTYDIPFSICSEKKRFRNFARTDWNLFRSLTNDFDWNIVEQIGGY